MYVICSKLSDYEFCKVYMLSGIRKPCLCTQNTPLYITSIISPSVQAIQVLQLYRIPNC